jgi:ubiquinone/menaquinone biosynthesis C-methylase UbiE
MSNQPVTEKQLHPSLLERLQCPKCGGAFRAEAKTLLCLSCGTTYPVEQGVPLLIEKRETDDWDYLQHYKTDAEVFDYFEEQTGATEHSERRLREYILHELPKSASVLDVGCGSAWVAKHLQNTDTFLCSLDATIVNTAKALEKYPWLTHVAIVADAFHLPFRDGSFDAVIASEIIEHVVDPAAFVGELFRVVKPGGTLIISTPYKEVLRYTLCIHCNQNTPLNAHLHSFDENILTNLYRGSDLKAVEWKSFGNKALLHLRTYAVLKYLPFGMWKMIDATANSVVNARANVIMKYRKRV